ncbi:MAG: rod shape-determining protein MreD [Bacteroidales bacterium]|nr:rod shape-determining protein MreD [Bacteroidales bacterium]
MNRLVIQNVIRGLVLIFFQVMVLNNIYLGGYVNPFLYILFILMLPVGMPKAALIFLSFLAGFFVDLFSSTLGMHTFSATLIGFLRVVLADNILTKREKIMIDVPSIKNIPFSTYTAYVVLLTFVYSLSYYIIESFLISDMLLIIIRAVLSTAVTYLMIISCEFLFMGRKKK